MGIREILNRGIEYVNTTKDALVKSATEKKESIQEFNLLITNSNSLDNMMPYAVNNQTPQTGREEIILSTCLSLNVENSKLINSLIPLNETVLDIKRVSESKTQIDYIFIATNKKLWIMNKNQYKNYYYNEISNFEIVNKSLLSQGVKFNDMAFSFEGNEKDVQRFIDIATNELVRSNVIAEKTSYLCGVEPNVQFLNRYLTGVTIGEDGVLVLHNGKLGNKLTSLNDIEYMQLMLDNNVILTKGKGTQSQTSVEKPCRKISIKFVLKNETYTIDIMPENMFSTEIKTLDKVFRDNIEFARNVMSYVENLMKML